MFVNHVMEENVKMTKMPLLLLLLRVQIGIHSLVYDVGNGHGDIGGVQD